MRKPGTNPADVKQSDVLCDFCHRAWTNEIPMMEGHQGSCVCGDCLTLAYRAVVHDKVDSSSGDFTCPMCLERNADRAELNREGESGWRSPKFPDAVICRRCIKLAAGTLNKDPGFAWTTPVADG